MKPFVPNRLRRGFTLVELLIVMGIIIVLSALAILVIPSTSANNAVIRASDQITSWIVSTRNRALRDKAPRGIHILRNGNNQATEIEIVEQPDPFRPVDTNGNVVALQIPAAANGTNTPSLVGTQSFDGIQAGDYLRVNFTGTDARVYRITSTPTANKTTGNVDLTVSPAMNEPQNFNNALQIQTRNYTILRGWRPLAGEPALQLPKGTVIDLQEPTNGPSPPPAYSLNISSLTFADVILFTKAGPVMDNTGGKIILGVRRPDENNPAKDDGEPILITIYPRTGATATHPRSSVGNPFQFALDGKGSGL